MLKINKTGLTGFLEGPLDELKGEGAYSSIRNIKLQKFKEKKGYRFNLEVISYLAKKKAKKYDKFISFKQSSPSNSLILVTF